MTEQAFNLIVVGGGIAGLSAAYYWMTEVDQHARILIVEQGAQLGGAAVQHTFEVDGRRLVSPGGAQELTFPSSFAPAVKSALSKLGVDVDRFHSCFAPGHYLERGAGGHGFAFSTSVWGRSHLVACDLPAAGDFSRAPIAPRASAEIAALISEPTDWLTGRSDAEKLAELRSRSCDQLLRDFASLHDDTHRFLRHSTSAQSGMTFDQHPALDAALVGYLGLNGIGVRPAGSPWEGLTQTGARFFPHFDPPIFRFPDGTATIARALAHYLIPGLFEASTVDERLTADMSVGALDAGEQVQILLNTKATHVRHDGPDHVLADVERAGNGTTTYRADAAIVAAPAYSAAWLVPELTRDQQATAACLGRYPIVSASIALRNWRAWQSLGISRLSWPGHPTWQIAGLEFPVTIGACTPSPSPDQPTTATALGSLTAPGLIPAAGAAVGRQRLVTAQQQISLELRHLLAETLAPGGFDVDRDVAGTRIEFWPHGYARYSTSRDMPGDGSATAEAKRLLADGVGRIAVAGVDVIDHPFLDGAMESAHLAVTRLAHNPSRRPE